MTRKLERYGIVVGSRDEYEQALMQPLYDVVLSVSDEPPVFAAGVFRHYWYPINELSQWGYAPFFWSKRILDFHTGRNERILIHCTAGVHRSPMILFAWLLSRELKRCGWEGCPLESINEVIGHGEDYAGQFCADIRDGRIPPDLARFYQIMDENPSFGLSDCLGRLDRHRSH